VAAGGGGAYVPAALQDQVAADIAANPSQQPVAPLTGERLLSAGASERLLSAGATVRMAGDDRDLGYLHATAPTRMNPKNSTLRLVEDNACTATFTLHAPLDPQATVTVQLATELGRVIDTIRFSLGQLPSVKKLRDEQRSGSLESDQPSDQKCLRVWKTADGTGFEISAIRALTGWDTGATVYQKPEMYRFDLLVGDDVLPLQYRFDRLRKQLDGDSPSVTADSGEGMFYAGSVRLKNWLSRRASTESLTSSDPEQTVATGDATAVNMQPPLPALDVSAEALATLPHADDDWLRSLTEATDLLMDLPLASP